MKTTRKNPFGPQTTFSGPTRSQQEPAYSEDIGEDPSFQNVGQPTQQWGSQPQSYGGRMENPFGHEQPFPQNDGYGHSQQYQQEDYSDFKPSQNQMDSSQQDFGNSGWSQAQPKPQFTQFNPQPEYEKQGYGMSEGQMTDLNEPPLLEDLGIDIKQITRKVLSVASLRKVNQEVVDDADLAGPLLIAIIFGTILLFRGKVQFGYIYGFGLTGCVGIYCLFKAMVNREQSLDLYTIMSVLGYCLLPFNILAAVALVLPVFNLMGGVLCLLIILWSTYMATQFVDVMMKTENKRMIIAYPIFLFYMCFLLLAIF